MKPIRTLLGIAGFAIALAAGAEEAPIRILVGFQPGGGSDIIARLVAERMKVSLGTNVVVENRPGANGFIAAEALKNAPPDGRTLMVAPIVVTVFAPLTHAGLRYDPVRDFAPVSLAAGYQLALAVGPASPARTLHEYIASVRANPANAAYGLPTIGGPPHFVGVMLGRAAGLDLVPVPYKGGSPLVTDLVGGQVPAAITVLSELVPHHDAGKLRILATSGSERSPAAPGVPTFRELGFPGIEGSGWQAFHTTAGTPRPVIDRLSAAIAAALKAPEVRERLLAIGMEPVGSTPDELARRVADDTVKWAPLVRASGFRADEPDVRQALAPTGKLRVALFETNAVHVTRDPATGQLKGVAHDVGRELAKRLGVPFEPVLYSAFGALLEAGKAGAWDVAFLGVTPERAVFLDFTATYLSVEFGYLVPAGSAIAATGDVDRTGVRIVAVTQGTPDVYLSRTLRSATLVRVPALAPAVELVASGNAEVFAALKPVVVAASSRMPGSRVLDAPGTDDAAMAMPKGRGAAAAAYARRFIEDAKAEGLVKAAIERAALTGVVVAARE